MRTKHSKHKTEQKHKRSTKELDDNKLYNKAKKLYKAALLTRCYVQQSLSPYIDSEVNHKQCFYQNSV